MLPPFSRGTVMSMGVYVKKTEAKPITPLATPRTPAIGAAPTSANPIDAAPNAVDTLVIISAVDISSLSETAILSAILYL